MATYNVKNLFPASLVGIVGSDSVRWSVYVDKTDSVANIVTDFSTNTRDLSAAGVQNGDILIIIGYNSVGGVTEVGLRVVTDAANGGVAALS